MDNAIQIGPYLMGFKQPLLFICGPCVIEGEDEALFAAETLIDIFQGIPFVYKSSYDKANRSSIHSYRGPGLKKGLKILERIKKTFNIPLMTDIHTPEEALEAGAICDILQIPAFLCRQTDLFIAAAKTSSVINIKKGQFMAPWDMKNAIEKLTCFGKKDLFLTERGTTFGYNNLVSDMRSIPILRSFGYPVCFDATHSIQLPGGEGTKTGGQKEFIPYLTKASIAAGADCIYMEAHRNPKEAKSDGSNMLSFEELPLFISELKQLYDFLHLEKAHV